MNVKILILLPVLATVGCSSIASKWGDVQKGEESTVPKIQHITCQPWPSWARPIFDDIVPKSTKEGFLLDPQNYKNTSDMVDKAIALLENYRAAVQHFLRCMNTHNEYLDSFRQ